MNKSGSPFAKDGAALQPERNSNNADHHQNLDPHLLMFYPNQPWVA